MLGRLLLAILAIGMIAFVIDDDDDDAGVTLPNPDPTDPMRPEPPMNGGDHLLIGITSGDALDGGVGNDTVVVAQVHI